MKSVLTFNRIYFLLVSWLIISFTFQYFDGVLKSSEVANQIVFFGFIGVVRIAYVLLVDQPFSRK